MPCLYIILLMLNTSEKDVSLPHSGRLLKLKNKSPGTIEIQTMPEEYGLVKITIEVWLAQT